MAEDIFDQVSGSSQGDIFDKVATKKPVSLVDSTGKSTYMPSETAGPAPGASPFKRPQKPAPKPQDQGLQLPSWLDTAVRGIARQGLPTPGVSPSIQAYQQMKARGETPGIVPGTINLVNQKAGQAFQTNKGVGPEILRVLGGLLEPEQLGSIPQLGALGVSKNIARGVGAGFAANQATTAAQKYGQGDVGGAVVQGALGALGALPLATRKVKFNPNQKAEIVNDFQQTPQGVSDVPALLRRRLPGTYGEQPKQLSPAPQNAYMVDAQGNIVPGFAPESGPQTLWQNNPNAFRAPGGKPMPPKKGTAQSPAVSPQTAEPSPTSIQYPEPPHTQGEAVLGPQHPTEREILDTHPLTKKELKTQADMQDAANSMNAMFPGSNAAVEKIGRRNTLTIDKGWETKLAGAEPKPEVPQPTRPIPTPTARPAPGVTAPETSPEGVSYDTLVNEENKRAGNIREKIQARLNEELPVAAMPNEHQAILDAENAGGADTAARVDRVNKAALVLSRAASTWADKLKAKQEMIDLTGIDPMRVNNRNQGESVGSFAHRLRRDYTDEQWTNLHDNINSLIDKYKSGEANAPIQGQQQLYHGSPKTGLTELHPGMAEAFGNAIYLGTDASGKIQEHAGSQGQVYSVNLSPDAKIFDWQPKNLFQLEGTKAWKEISGKWEDVHDAIAESPAFVNKALRELGYDGVRMDNSDYGTEYAIFNKDKVKINAPIPQERVQSAGEEVIRPSQAGENIAGGRSGAGAGNQAPVQEPAGARQAQEVGLDAYLRSKGFDPQDAPVNRLSDEEMKAYPITRAILDYEKQSQSSKGPQPGDVLQRGDMQFTVRGPDVNNPGNLIVESGQGQGTKSMPPESVKNFTIKRNLRGGSFDISIAEDVARAVASGARYLANGAVTFAKWSAEMIKEFGETIRPHLVKLWDQSHDQWEENKRRPASVMNTEAQDRVNRLKNATGPQIPPTKGEVVRNALKTAWMAPSAWETIATPFHSVFRHGLPLTINHPKMALDSVADTWKAFASRDGFNEVRQYIDNHPDKAMADHFGVADTGQHISSPTKGEEEMIANAFLQKIPGGGPVVGALKNAMNANHRGFVTYLDLMALRAFSKKAKQLQDWGIDPMTHEADYKALAGLVNNERGRGSLGPLENQAALAAGIIYAPRLQVARMALLNPLYYAKLLKTSPRVAQIAVTDAAKGITLAISAIMAAKQAGAEVSTDPKDSDFLKVKIGGRFVDPLGGFRSYIPLVVQSLTGEKSINGKVISNVGPGETRGKVAAGLLIKEVRKKLSPSAGLAYDVSPLSKDKEGINRNVIGEPVTAQGEAERIATPFFLRDLLDYFKSGDLGSALIGELASQGGMTSYEPSFSQSRSSRLSKSLLKTEKPINMKSLLSIK